VDVRIVTMRNNKSGVYLWEGRPKRLEELSKTTARVMREFDQISVIEQRRLVRYYLGHWRMLARMRREAQREAGARHLANTQEKRDG
jgi:hypothetical protein